MGGVNLSGIHVNSDAIANSTTEIIYFAARANRICVALQ